MQDATENKLKSIIQDSGNSDVDLVVNMEVDTKVIAYGMLCSLYAKGDLTEHQLQKGIHKLDSLVEEDRKRRNIDSNGVSKPKIYDFPKQKQKQRRSWL
ncbi:hypothetical protein [Gracilibacillus sp. YIM 98692]|uniref:hypothetical protein n=1 Tax=Gracilibacillus sp. YIM 98692 TaxID=2663532 RepID=UPI0013D39A96|nr:hypothetical protein [Gracilibacillus sp. YIM 98692]